MNKLAITVFMFFFLFTLQAQVSKTITIGAGGLSSALSKTEKSTITNLTITGTIDARDFKIMRDSMAVLSGLNISNASVTAYTGTLGTSGSVSQVYPVNTIPESAFVSKVTLKSIVFPNNITTIGSWSFMNCSALTSVVFPLSLTTLKVSAFRGCSSLNTLTIPSSVSLIEAYCFSWCPVAITVSTSNMNYSSTDGVLFDKGKTVLIHCPASKSGSYSIPETVGTISPEAFLNCQSLSSVVIPSTVTTIGRGAFYQCLHLSTVILPPNLTTIEEETFNNCRNLVSIVIPPKITTIKFAAFINCVGLASVTIPSSVTTIGDNAFANCSALSSITIPVSVQVINKQAFSNCTGLISIYVDSPNPIDLSLSPEVFGSVNKTTCTLYVPYLTREEYATAYQWGDFLNIVNRPGFYLPSTRVDILANEGSKDSIAILSTVDWSVSQGSLWLTVNHENGTGNDTLVFMANANPEYSDRKASLTISGTGVPSQTIDIIQHGIPKTVTVSAGGLSQALSPEEKNTLSNLKLIGTINACDFRTMRDSMPELSVIDLSETSIAQYSGTLGTTGTNTFYSMNVIPDYAFCTPGTLLGKTSLYRIALPSGATSIGNYAFYGCRNMENFSLSPLINRIGNYTFYNCTGLTSLVSNSSLTGLGAYSFFGCKGLTSFQFPSTMESIGNNAFEKCSNLTSLTIPESVTSIGNAAFKACIDLQNITIQASIFSIGKELFYGCSRLTSFSVPTNVKTIDENAFGYCSNLSSITFPPLLKTINIGAFRNCTGLTSVSLPSTVSSIGEYAFNMCSMLSSFIVPPLVSCIEDYTFEGCSQLISITISSSVKSIGNYAFYDCDQLTHVDLPSSVTTIGERAFANCYDMSSIVIPHSVSSIGRNAFCECWNLTSVSIPQSMTTIQPYTFFRSGLTSIAIPSSIQVIEDEAFSNCFDLDSIKVGHDVPVDLINSVQVFDLVDKATCKLYVPYGTSGLYAVADQWEDFINIVEYDFYADPDTTILSPEEGSNVKVWLSAHIDWTTSSDQEWLIVSPGSGSGSDSLQFTAEANYSNVERTAWVTVSAEGHNPVRIRITQQPSQLSNFHAQALSSNQIKVGWTPNISNDSVLVVYSLNDSIEEPIDGETYIPGQLLPCGATVLYLGTDTSCVHASLASGTKYFYKAWSYRPGFYSGSKNCSAFSHFRFPYSQDFSDGLLPAGWSVTDSMGNGQVWTFDEPDGYSFDFTTGENGYAILDSYGYGFDSEQKSELFSPVFDLSDLADSVLDVKFEHDYYCDNDGDSATFSYSFDNGMTWMSTTSWNHSTNEVEIFSKSFISELSGQSQIMFKWSYVGQYPGSWAIDDFSVSAHSCNPIADFPYVQEFSEGVLPTCWSIDDYEGSNQIWTFNNPGGRVIKTSTNGNGFAIIDSDKFGSNGIQNCDLVTSLFDFSRLKNNQKIVLEFSHYYRHYAPGSATFSFRNNYGTWTDLQTWTEDTENPENFSIDLTSELAGLSQVQFRWNYIGEYSWYWAIDDVKISAEVPAVSKNLSIADTIVRENELICFNAFDSIVLAGEGPSVIFKSGSAVEIIAGKTIRFLPGFYAESGSALNAHITTDSSFCSLQPAQDRIYHQVTEKSQSPDLLLRSSTLVDEQGKQIKVYPNPNNGQFFVDLVNFSGPTSLIVTSLTGSVVYQTQTCEKTQLIDPGTRSKGVYLLIVRNGKSFYSRKVVIR